MKRKSDLFNVDGSGICLPKLYFFFPEIGQKNAQIRDQIYAFLQSAANRTRQVVI